MADYPAWKDQTVEQKLDFLHEWLMNVDRAHRAISARIQGLDDRLRVVEAANAQQTKPQTPVAPKD